MEKTRAKQHPNTTKTHAKQTTKHPQNAKPDTKPPQTTHKRKGGEGHKRMVAGGRFEQPPSGYKPIRGIYVKKVMMSSSMGR